MAGREKTREKSRKKNRKAAGFPGFPSSLLWTLSPIPLSHRGIPKFSNRTKKLFQHKWAYCSSLWRKYQHSVCGQLGNLWDFAFLLSPVSRFLRNHEYLGEKEKERIAEGREGEKEKKIFLTTWECPLDSKTGVSNILIPPQCSSYSAQSSHLCIFQFKVFNKCWPVWVNNTTSQNCMHYWGLEFKTTECLLLFL